VPNINSMAETLVTNSEPSTRPSRAEQTRARLQSVALDLFVRQGFEATTVEQIAAAAGVSHMTFFRYFPTKESAAVTDPYDPLLAQAVAAQPTDLPPFERVRLGLRMAMAEAPPTVDLESQARIVLMAMTPALRAKAWENTNETQRVVVEALEAGGAERTDALVAAGACLGAVMAALLEWGAHQEREGSLGACIIDALDRLEPARLGGAR
jgi:AcrR family transcriptional regulator